VGREPFSEDTKLKCLLWSNRHCCVCDKACGLDIEIAHIDPSAGNDFDNAIPVCYQHHAEIGRYNEEHPRGNKYRIKELKKRREQIYEKYTRQLVPPLIFHLAPRKNDPFVVKKEFCLPRVRFIIENRGLHLPVKFNVKITVFLGGNKLELKGRPYYTGGTTWLLNAGHTFFGNFSVPKECVDSTERLVIELQVTAIDRYYRPHDLLPNCFTYVRKEGYWITEPRHGVN
jgi:hypothetical protein